MCKMVELLSAPFSLSTGIRSCLEFHGGRGEKAAATDPGRTVIKKEPFVCTLEIEFFSISRNKLPPWCGNGHEDKMPPLHRWTQ